MENAAKNTSSEILNILIELAEIGAPELSEGIYSEAQLQRLQAATAGLQMKIAGLGFFHQNYTPPPPPPVVETPVPAPDPVEEAPAPEPETELEAMAESVEEEPQTEAEVDSEPTSMDEPAPVEETVEPETSEAEPVVEEVVAEAESAEEEAPEVAEESDTEEEESEEETPEAPEIPEPVAEIPEPEPVPEPVPVVDNRQAVEALESGIKDLEKEMTRLRVPEGEASLHDRFMGRTDAPSLADRLKLQPISNLKSAIGLNDRFLFTNELFNGNREIYDRAIQELNHLQNHEEALRFVDFEFRERYSWDMEAPVVVSFMQYLERRYQ